MSVDQGATIQSDFNWMDLTPEDEHVLFGYYTRCPWDAGSRRHLALRLSQEDHVAQAGETAEVGVIDRHERRFLKVAETRAWNHHDGTVALWLKHFPGALVFNDFVPEGDHWRPVARVFSTVDGEIGRYDTHLSALSEDGRWGAAIDFARIACRECRYALAPMPRDRPQPDLDGDGLFLVDMHTGKKDLIVPYRRFYDDHPFPYALEGQYVSLNIPLFNRDSTRLMILFSHSPDPLGSETWTHLFTVGLDGGDLRCPLPDMYFRSHGGMTHQIWGRYPDEILVDANWFGDTYEYVVLQEDQQPIQAHSLSKGLGHAGHLKFSPDGQWLVADTYTDAEGIQTVGLANAATGKVTELGRFTNHVADPWGPLRCDLHPRWSPDGHTITVDSTHYGSRKIFMLELAPVFSLISNGPP